MDLIALSKQLFGDGRTAARRISAKATAASADGYVTVNVGDGDDIEVPCVGGASAGDDVQVIVQSGTPVAIGATGWGDIMESKAEAAQQAAGAAANTATTADKLAESVKQTAQNTPTVTSLPTDTGGYEKGVEYTDVSTGAVYLCKETCDSYDPSKFYLRANLSTTNPALVVRHQTADGAETTLKTYDAWELIQLFEDYGWGTADGYFPAEGDQPDHDTPIGCIAYSPDTLLATAYAARYRIPMSQLAYDAGAASYLKAGGSVRWGGVGFTYERTVEALAASCKLYPYEMMGTAASISKGYDMGAPYHGGWGFDNYGYESVFLTLGSVGFDWPPRQGSPGDALEASLNRAVDPNNGYLRTRVMRGNDDHEWSTFRATPHECEEMVTFVTFVDPPKALAVAEDARKEAEKARQLDYITNDWIDANLSWL